MSRPRIAVLFSEFVFPYSRQSFAGVAEACEAADIDLVAVICGPWRDPDPAITMRNVLYRWIDPTDYDGFIISLSSLAQHVPLEEFLAFLGPILDRPHVFLGAEVGGHDSLVPNTQEGVSALVDHLVTLHGVDRVALVRGPSHHAASNFRQRGLEEACLRHGVTPVILNLGTRAETPVEVVSECRHRGLFHPKTALLAVGEDLALGLVEELGRQGVVVPRDLIVCGTSMTPQSALGSPSLATLDNHHEGVGAQAVGLLLEQWSGRSAGRALRHPVDVVPRASCGCLAADDPLGMTPERLLDLAAQRVARGEGGPYDPRWGQRLSEFAGDQGRFLYAALDEVLARTRFQIHQRDQSILFDHLHFFRQIGASLISEFDLAEVFRRLRDRLGVRHAYLSAYQPSGEPRDTSVVLQASRDGTLLDRESGVLEFATRELIPRGLRPRGRTTFIVEAVFHRDRHLGILAVEPARDSVLVLESIASQIAAAMDNQRQREEISRLVNYDALTGLPNRRLFLDRLSQLRRQSQRSGHSFTVAYLDLDDFKKVNDTWGHEAGDQLLVEVAGLLSAMVRDGDTVARLGGDEFVLLLPGIQSDEGARAVAARILELFQGRWVPASPFGVVSPSVGLARFPDDADTEADLLRHADAAMYRAKRAGRNSFALYSDPEGRSSGKT